MEITKRRSVNDSLKKYTYSGNENDFIEITEWANGDGVDAVINTVQGDNRMFNLSYDELDALYYLTKHLTYNK